MKKLLSISIISILIMLISACCPNSTQAQSRTDKQIVQFDSRSDKLTSATGWELNDESGKWVENHNFISDRKSKSYWISHLSQNFIWIQFATILKENTKYYIFLYEKLAGVYKYPSIREDWESENRTCFFIMTENDYKEIKSQVELKTGEDVKINSKMDDYITDRYRRLGGEHSYNDENLLAKITNTIENPGYSEKCFIFNSQDIDGQSVIRFKLPTSSIIQDLEEYFEVSLSDFQKILL